MIRKIIRIIMFVTLLVGIWQLPAYAKDVQKDDLKFSFDLTVDGGDIKEVSYGDVITVALKLNRADADIPYTMYAMQDEIRYDGTFFELVEDGILLTPGITSTDIANTDQFREFYMNYLSMSGGSQWDASTLIGTIQLRVIAKSGTAKITSQDFLVSLKDGSGSYPCEANEVTVVVSTECTVRFDTRGGSEIPSQTVQYGEKIIQPDDPLRNGYEFELWYADIDLTDEWDFENDIVQSNMTLYAKWSERTEETTVSGLDRTWKKYYWVLLLLLIFAIVFIIYFKYKRNKRK